MDKNVEEISRNDDDIECLTAGISTSIPSDCAGTISKLVCGVYYFPNFWIRWTPHLWYEVRNCSAVWYSTAAQRNVTYTHICHKTCAVLRAYLITTAQRTCGTALCALTNQQYLVYIEWPTFQINYYRYQEPVATLLLHHNRDPGIPQRTPPPSARHIPQSVPWLSLLLKRGKTS